MKTASPLTQAARTQRSSAFGSAGALAPRASRARSVAARAASAKARRRRASPVANGYAAALAESAQASGTLEAVHGDCEKMGAFDAGSPLVAVLSNPVLDDAKKRDVLAKMAAEASFTPVFVSFVNLLIDKRRANLLDQILARFEEIYCSMTDTQIANVTSAVKLETEQQMAIARKLQSMTGAKNIKLKPTVDKALLGGFIVSFGKDGSAAVDMSVKGQLDAIAAQLTPVAA